MEKVSTFWNISLVYQSWSHNQAIRFVSPGPYFLRRIAFWLSVISIKIGRRPASSLIGKWVCVPQKTCSILNPLSSALKNLNGCVSSAGKEHGLEASICFGLTTFKQALCLRLLRSKKRTFLLFARATIWCYLVTWPREQHSRSSLKAWWNKSKLTTTQEVYARSIWSAIR